MKFEYSQYQKDIFNWIQDGDSNGAAIAVAGSSKTTTAVNGMEYINPMLCVRFNCFNKIIKDELSQKTSHLKNIQVSTYNAFGWGICRKQFGFIKLDKNKTDNILRYVVLNRLQDEEDRKTYYKYRYVISKLVGLCKGFAYTTIDEAMKNLDQLIDYHAIDIKDIAEFKQLFYMVYQLDLAENKIMDFNDQLFKPIQHNLDIPKTDFLIIDEWQDTNLVQYELVKRSVGNSGRILVIGDPDQSIYGFRGTAPGIVDQFIKEFQAKKLPLYICYRCPKAAVQNAQQWVPHIEPWEKAKLGVVTTVSESEYKKMITEDDMVLCRCTTPLISSCLKFIVDGRPAYVKGREVADGLINLVERVSNYNPRLDSTRFHDMFREYVIQTKTEYEKYNRETALQLLEDQADAVDAMILGTSIVQDLTNKINSLFSDQYQKGICHMTIHKSKGLETSVNGHVFSLPYKIRKLKKEWMQDEERRLAYVEATRTRNNHYYVKDSMVY